MTEELPLTHLISTCKPNLTSHLYLHALLSVFSCVRHSSQFYPSATTYSPLSSPLCSAITQVVAREAKSCDDGCSSNSRNQPGCFLFQDEAATLTSMQTICSVPVPLLAYKCFFLFVPAWQVVSPRCRYKDKQTAAWLTSD